MRWWPRTIRWQMLAGLVLLEALSLALFAVLLTLQQGYEAGEHARPRLVNQVASVALQAKEAMEQERPGWVGLSVKMMGHAPSVAFAMVTDSAGNPLFVGPETRSRERSPSGARADSFSIAGCAADIYCRNRGVGGHEAHLHGRRFTGLCMGEIGSSLGH